MKSCLDRVTLRWSSIQPFTLAFGWWLSLSLLLVGAPMSSTAQDSPRAATAEPGPQPDSSSSLSLQDPFLKLKSELVVLPISVTDSLGRFVPGLRRDQFEIYEQDVPQTARFFSTEDVPISVGIILDVSGSMKSKIPRAREAFRRFIEFSNPQDEFFAITFNHRVTHLADFSDGEVLLSYLPFLQAKGRTALYDAVYEGVLKLKQGRYGKRVLLVISDGQDNSSRYGFRSLSRLMKESDVQIYTVGTPDPTQYNDYFERQGIGILQHISKLSGGRQFTVYSAATLEPVCIYIARELRQQYTIGYTSSNSTPDGKWRKVKVRATRDARFKITKGSLEKLKAEGVPDDVLRKLASLKERKMKVVGEEPFLEVVRTTVGNEPVAQLQSLILKHAEREEGEKLRVHTKSGYYAPPAQP
jgi:Ca-activated chloride channel family protein